jgi:hypothetical protein
LQTDLNNNTVAGYNLITPDQYNDMHSSLDAGFTYNGTHYTGDQASIAEGDNFLSMILPQIMDSKAYKQNGVIVIWFDETEGGDTSAYTLPLVVISKRAKGDAYNSTLTYTHSSDLKTLQEIFGISAPGGGFLGDANTPGTNDLSDLFKNGSIKPLSAQGNPQGDGSFRPGEPGGFAMAAVNHQAVNSTTTTSNDRSSSFARLVPGTSTVTITPAPGPQTVFTTATGADPTIRDPGLGFLVAGYTGHHHSGFDNLVFGDVYS